VTKVREVAALIAVLLVWSVLLGMELLAQLLHQ
jgi:hypothetical protein